MAFRPFPVKQVELQLEGDHRLEAEFRNLLERARQDVPRFEGQRPSRAVLEGEKQLAQGALCPGHGLQATWQGVRNGIGVTIGKALAAGIMAAPAGIQQEDRSRKTHPGLPDLSQVFYRVALATDNPRKIGEQQVDGKGVRITPEEFRNFRVQAWILMQHGALATVEDAASSSATAAVATSASRCRSAAGACLVDLHIAHAVG